ncbi:MAG: hypothetical protein DWP95_01825 [Proteobacteria bacterium]|nr:MAG: hypothetical protein DWP95_01825 [Pseudomonadota bacterium]
MKPSCIYKIILIFLSVVWISPLHAAKTDNTVSDSRQQLKAIIANDTIIADDGAADDYFGGSVSVSGTRALVGAEGNDEIGNYAGAAYVYEFNGTDWSQMDKLTANDGAAYDYFGGAVSLSGNTAMVGARGENSLTGAVYIFEFNGLNWVQIDKLTANDAASGDEFGSSISLQGDRVLIGAPRDDDNAYNSGTVYIFEFNGLSWNQAGKLLPDNTVFEELFGSAVSLDNNRALVGASNGVNSSNVRTGTAYVFHFNGSSWNQAGKFRPSDGTATNYFGFSVSLSGDYALVGAHGHGFYTGAAYLYYYDGNSWGQEVKLTGDDSELEDAFGISVSLNANRALIGAYRGDNLSQVDSGAIYIFDFNGIIWAQSLKLSNNTNGAANDFFGRSVSLSNSWVLSGATGGNGTKGIVHIYLDDPVYMDGFE